MLTFTSAFSPPLTFQFSSPVFFCWVLTRGSILLSLVPWIPGSHPFLLLPFQMHISSLFLPLLILLELPPPAFSLLPFPYPYCPYSPGFHPHTPLQWGQVVAIVITCSYWLQRSFCLVLWTGAPRSSLQGLTVLAVKTIDIEIQQWLYPQNNGAACYGEPMKLEVLRAAY